MAGFRRFGVWALGLGWMAGGGMAAGGQKNPAATVSAVVTQSTQAGTNQQIFANIDGHHYELENWGKDGLSGWLTLGTYQARLKSSKHQKPYISTLTYTFVFDNGDTEDFTVIGESK